MNFLFNLCSKHKTCSNFNRDNYTCTKAGGNYYGAGRMCGKYREAETKKRQLELKP